ncbi:MAG: hypothetical protein KDA25_05150 [Phycisphaerales bacterium]|nr:hypothetical protein [Phycisphaerales bacterium]
MRLMPVLLFMFILALPAVASIPEDVYVNERLERMLEAGDEHMIAETFRRYPDMVLPYIDGYFEGGLKMIEDQASGATPEVTPAQAEAAALTSYRTGIRFAEIADRVFNESIFIEYAGAFASWSPTERGLFRQGQAEVQAGRRAMQTPREALAHFETALRLSSQLQDHWGIGMAQDGIARAQMALGEFDAAHRASLEADTTNARLRLRRSEIRALLVCAEARRKLALPDMGVSHLRKAWNLTTTHDDDDFRRTVLQALLAGLDQSGAADEAAALRKRHPDLL